MQPKIEEENKKAGICYAVTDDGLELPVIDLTHPAFALNLSEADLETLQQSFIHDIDSPGKAPGFVRKLVFSFMRSRSIIMRGLMGAEGTFMSGMNTYMMKLGADNLNQSYFSAIDRVMAGSSAGSYVRLRLQDIAHLVADALVAPLESRRGAALHLINIGGGPASDSLNTLILVHQSRPELLAGRPIAVHTLDLDTAGSDFGARALAALLAEGGPLHGLQIGFDHISYNWSDPAPLRDLIGKFEDRGSVVAASSEGALFEYGSDGDISGNLEALHEGTPPDAVMAGSVTRADALGLKANRVGDASRAAINFRGLEAFTALAHAVGWKVARSIDRPLSHDVLLQRGG